MPGGGGNVRAHGGLNMAWVLLIAALCSVDTWRDSCGVGVIINGAGGFYIQTGKDCGNG